MSQNLLKRIITSIILLFLLILIIFSNQYIFILSILILGIIICKESNNLFIKLLGLNNSKKTTFLKKFNINNQITKIKLLCYPRIFGYVFNPLSIFYCYEKENLRAIFYEVKNTFNEQHTYIFKVTKNEKIEQKCKKKFYVSPFMDMNTYYNFKLLNPKERLSVFIKQTDNSGTVLTATQVGDKKEFSFKQLLINFFKYPLMTFKIISSIHFEAFLLWKKGAIYRRREKKIINNLSYEEN